MHHRVLRLLPRPALLAPSSSLAAHTRPSPTRRPTPTTRVSSVSHVLPLFIRDHDWLAVHPGRSDECPYHADSSVAGTPVAANTFYTPPPPRLLPLPESARSLHRNLLYLLSFRASAPSLPALIDYHALYPELHSTRSYNLLISFSLRHAAFGTTQWLLTSMLHNNIPANLETRKLNARYLIQTGRWDQAWSQAIASSPKADTLPESPDGPRLPLPLWLEFFRTLKRGSVRTRSKTRWKVTDDGESVREDGLIVLTDPANRGALYLARLDMVMKCFPLTAPQELAMVPPRTAYFVVKQMLFSDQKERALSFAKTYLSQLPGTIESNWAQTCLEMIHLFISYGSGARGLRKFYEARRTMISLVEIHASVRPTSTTLFLLLGSLLHSRYCGTIAWAALGKFKARWGAEVEDRQVQRRVMSYAIKEGRTDIADRIIDSNGGLGWAFRAWTAEKTVVGGVSRPGGGKLRRQPGRKVFKRNGRENRLWKLLNGRRRRMVERQ